MLALIGIRKNVNIEIREMFSLGFNKQKKTLESLKDIYEEVVIISTCNRTEIYISGCLGEKEDVLRIFEILEWDLSLAEHIFYLKDSEVAKHLMEVVCGFHSKILGEDQILGQVKDAYELSLEHKALKQKLLKLFEEAIACGKRFRSESELYKIPVSSSSIAVSKAISFGSKSLMVLGYGTIGNLVVKYALSSKLEKLYIVVRNKEKVNDIKDSRVTVLDFNEYKNFINEVDSIISCTSSPHIVIQKNYINNYGNDILLIDLALPRDIDEQTSKISRVTLLDIDEISKLDLGNKNLRKLEMNKHKYIVN